MNRGNRIVGVRLEPDLLEQLTAAIESNNAARKGPPYSLSSWIRQAILERLDKQRRARSKKGGPARGE